jgi:hypothetical protein
MGLVIFLGILLILGIAGLIAGILAMPKTITDTYGRQPVERRNYWRTGTIIGSVVLIVIAPVIFVLTGIKSVPTKSVGVVTSFGRVGSEYSPGAHWMVPWKSLNIVQDTIQSDSFAQANCPLVNGQPQPCADVQQPSGTKGYCIIVRLAGLNQGCIDVQLQTQVEPQAIPELYGNYSSYGPDLALDVDQFVVQRELRTELNRVLGDYNVIADVSASLQVCAANHPGTACNTTVSQFSQFDPQVLTALRTDAELAGKVDVLDVNLQFPHFTGNVETAIETIQNKYTDIVQATLQEQVNAATSAANAALIKSNSLSPAVLQNECYTTTQDAIKAGYSLPTGWNCSGSSSSGLILPGK